MISAQVLPTHFGGVAGAGTLLSLILLVALGRIKDQLKFWWTRCEKKALPSGAKSFDGETSGQPRLYRVWGEDKVLHGPLDLATLKTLSSESFERLHHEAPTLAIHFLLVLARTLASRIRRTNKRLEDSIGFIRISGIVD